ncbi:glycosyltransferase [Chloroflexota bacterium]
MAEDITIPIISVIVPCYGQSDDLPNCLRALLNQQLELPYEIILVDSASDPTVARTAEPFPEIRLVRSETRLFCGRAKNLGAEHARADFFAFTDADCIPDEKWLLSAYQALQVGKLAAGGPVLNALPFNPIAVTDNLLQFVDNPPGRPAGVIKHTPGCNLATSKEVFIKAGGFANQEFGEDVKLTISINEIHPSGLHYVPKMWVLHTGRRTIISFWEHQKLFGYTRGYHALYISRTQQRLGRRMYIIPFVVGTRLIYIFKRIIQLNLKTLPRNILLLPLILTGLLAWGIGFRQGCIQSKKFSTE